MQLYARVFVQILDSSLAENWQARHVFEDMLKLASDGVVDMTRQAIARRTNVPLEVINEAIAVLEAPDPASRDQQDDGRRLVRIDEHRDWGWMIVNWSKYEAIRSSGDEKVKTRERVRRFRERKRNDAPPHTPSTSKADPETESEAEAEAEAPLLKRYAPLPTVTAHKARPAKAAAAAPASQIEADWLAGVKADPAFTGINVDLELAKMNRWCKEHGKQPNRRRFINWLNRSDRPVGTTQPTRHTTTGEIDPSTL